MSTTDKCRHGVKIEGVYSCRLNPDAIGLCPGLCNKYESVMSVTHRSVCPKCSQPFSSVESVREYELKVEKMVDTINGWLLDGFEAHQAVELVAEVSE